MAGCLDHRNNTKCSGYRKSPKLRLWIWCIALQCLISFPCILSKCLGVNLTVRTIPDGDVTVEYGNPLEMYCVAEGNYTANDVEITLGGVTLKSNIIDNTTRKLLIEKPERQANTYFCTNTKTNKNCLKRVIVDTKPKNVTNFKCISKNFEILNCSWTCPNMFTTLNYSVAFLVNDNEVKSLYPNDSNTLTRYCVWTADGLPRYRQNEPQQYFILRASNAFGVTVQRFTIDHYAIVKPDPPYDLQIIKNGSHSVILKWKIPNNIIDFLECGLDHIIEYQIAKIDNKTQFHRVDTSHLPPRNKTYRFQLSNLPYAHVQYEVRVYIKSKKATSKEFWSNYSYFLFYTASERPSRPPDMIAGAFHHNTFNLRRIIFVYWKQLEEYEEAGANFTYKVVTSQGGEVKTLFPDKNKSLGYIKLNTTLDAIDVTVWSFNANGSSVNSSHMYIPPDKETRTLIVKSFTKMTYENGTYELSWAGIKNIDNYTLFWCQQNVSTMCTGRMDFTVLDPKKDKHVIDLPNQYRYQFAIAANNGSQSTGLVWALYCDISKDGYVMYGYPVHLRYDRPGKRFVTLKWEMDCAVQDGIINGYNISYCPIVETSSNCDESFDKLYVFVPNGKNNSVTINNLYPFRTYQFTLALDTKYGQKNIENATWVITTSEDAPTKPLNVNISNVKNNSLLIAWDPPQQRNGNIGKYVVLNYDKEFYVDEVPKTDKSRRQVTLTGLEAFTNYSFAVKACNIPLGVCSEVSPNDYVFVRTRIGAPSRLKAPTVKNNPDMLKWEKPEKPGGTLDFYQVRRVKDDMKPEIFDTTSLSISLTHCEGGVSSETYEVRALNYDEDFNHGVIFENNVDPPVRTNRSTITYPGEWSEPSTVACRSKDFLTISIILMGIFFAVGVGYAFVKCYKSYRKMEDIKPVLPHGLGEPEKEISKYTFGPFNPNNKEEKPSSDEMLLLPNIKSVKTTDMKQKDLNGDTSDQTDSTALSESSKGTIDRQASASDEGSDSSLHLEIEQIKSNHKNEHDDEEASSAVDTESSCESSPYLSNETFKKNPTSGYIQPVVNTATGYVTAQLPVKTTPPVVKPQPASSSYVMASLPPPTFSGGITPFMTNPISQSSGYVLREDPQAKLMLGLPKPTPSKALGPETLPTTASLPPPAKINADSSYMQLQSLDSLPSFKPSICNAVPLKSAPGGYVSPADQVINKHLNNMLTAGQLTEESAILDPSMSPDAYCRFSWSTDPANDNLHSLLADLPSRTSEN